MKQFEIVTDSCCDLTAEMADALGVSVVPLSMTLGDKTYVNYLDEREITFKEVYKQLRTTISAGTAAPNGEDYRRVIEPLLKAGRDVLLLSFSSALSSTYEHSVAAMKELQKLYPERDIRVFDTKCASLGQGLLVHSCATLANEGKSLDEVEAFARDNTLKLNHWFTCDSLQRLKLGGRISATSALLGGLLNIKPVMHVDNEGRLIPMAKVRSRQTSITALANKVTDTIVNPENQTIFISHGDCLDDVHKLMERISAKIKVKGFEVNYVGPVIGAHTGAGVLAVFFYANER